MLHYVFVYAAIADVVAEDVVSVIDGLGAVEPEPTVCSAQHAVAARIFMAENDSPHATVQRRHGAHGARLMQHI